MNANLAKYKWYLRDLGVLLAEKAREAKQARDDSGKKADVAFNNGRLMGFHEVISLMQQQAESFGIPLREIGLSDISPEKDLI